MEIMFQFEPGKAPITLTEAAVARAKLLMEKSGDEKVIILKGPQSHGVNSTLMKFSSCQK